MGFFDRLAGKASGNAAGEPAPQPEPASAASGGGVVPQLTAARARLEAKDLPAALEIYEQVLATAGDRADVLVTISGDLGVTGNVREIVDLIAPRYDADRHGPATGLNLLQAYLALREADAAQHILDILFALQRPELEDRLHGFSNAIAELIQADLPPVEPPPPAPSSGEAAPGPDVAKINFVSLSKPIWFYGLEPIAAEVLPSKEGRMRRVAFTQLALLGVENLAELTQKPETEPGRLTRAIPLWLAETFYFSPHYSPIAVVGIFTGQYYALLGAEWSTANLRQLVDTTEGGLDYIFTGALRESGGAYDLVLRVWEVKKLRERKTMTARWTAATADAELGKLHEQIRAFMEWSPEKSGAPYEVPASPSVWANALGTRLSLFFQEKELLPPAQVVLDPRVISPAADTASASARSSLAWLTLAGAAEKLGHAALPEAALNNSALVGKARAVLRS